MARTEEKRSKNVIVPSNAQRAPRWYPAEDVPKPKKARKTQRPTKFRDTLTPGTVLIILAGRFRGKRVVLLKKLEDSLLITGPFNINGVPLRRVNAKYVIATSTKIDLSSASPDLSKFNATYFSRSKKYSAKSSSNLLEGQGEKVKELSKERVADQKQVDKALNGVIKSTPHLRAYLASSFSLNKGDKPHEMKF